VQLANWNVGADLLALTIGKPHKDRKGRNNQNPLFTNNSWVPERLFDEMVTCDCKYHRKQEQQDVEFPIRHSEQSQFGECKNRLVP